MVNFTEYDVQWFGRKKYDTDQGGGSSIESGEEGGGVRGVGEAEAEKEETQRKASRNERGRRGRLLFS